jgi:hypothetical protein
MYPQLREEKMAGYGYEGMANAAEWLDIMGNGVIPKLTATDRAEMERLGVIKDGKINPTALKKHLEAIHTTGVDLEIHDDIGTAVSADEKTFDDIQEDFGVAQPEAESYPADFALGYRHPHHT